MHTPTAPRTLRLGTRDLELGSSQLGTLRDATPHLGDPAALRARLDDEGYLLLRGLQDRDLVLEARRQMVQVLRDEGVADQASGPLDARPASGEARRNGIEGRLGQCPAFRQVVESERIRRFMEGIYGGEALTFTYKWMRVVGPGDFTGAHYDVVYMGRGSLGVLTVWTPFGDLGYEHGTLAVVPGSHRLPAYQRVRETYGRMDVDRDRVSGGWFANDPLDITGRYGGGWATTEFRAGDVLVFGMFMMHMSLTNTSDAFRLTADTRWQRAGDPVDERWGGDKPKGHYAWTSEPQKMISIEAKRQEWGV